MEQLKLCLKIQYYRKLKGYLVKEMAEMIGISPESYTRYERGKHEIPLSKLLKIFNILGFEIKEPKE